MQNVAQPYEVEQVGHRSLVLCFRVSAPAKKDIHFTEILDYRNNPVYSRFLTTSYKGQLLEVTFTSNLNTDPHLKDEIDHIMDSIHLED